MQRPDETSETSMSRHENNMRYVGILTQTKQEKAYNGKLFVADGNQVSLALLPNQFTYIVIRSSRFKFTVRLTILLV